MLQVQYQSFELAFQYPFTISKGTKTHQPTLVVSLGMGRMRGWGEAPAISYYNVTVADMIASLEAHKADISRYALTDPMRFWHFLHHLIPGQHFLTAALDIAGWDLFAQMRRQPLYALLGIKQYKALQTDYTLGIDSAENMVAKLQAHPWPLYKIKISGADDIDLLRTLRQHTQAPFRIDANEALTYDDTLKLLPELQVLGVTLLEQPLPRDAREEMAALKPQSALPLYADEACRTEDEVKLCAAGYHGINIKLTKCGGITPALRMIAEARKLGLQVMMGSMNESSIGTAAVAHMAPLLNAVDADGPLLLKEDVADAIGYKDGFVLPTSAPGLGIRFWGEKKNSNKFPQNLGG